MDSAFKVLFMIAFSLFGFLACNLSKESSQPVVRQATGPGSYKAGAQVQANKKQTGPQPVDLSKLKATERASLQIQADDVIQLRKLSLAANRLFQGVWAGYWSDDSSRVYSVFDMLGAVLKAKFSDSGIPLASAVPRSKVATVAACRDHDYELIISSADTIKGVVTPISYTVMELSCSGNTQARYKLAEITKGKGAHGSLGYQIHFAKLGSILGDGIFFFGKDPFSCEMYPAVDGRLQKLSCQGIGQNRDKSTFIQFSQFNFDLSAENPITGQGEVYKINDNGEKVLSDKIILKDKPKDNVLEFADQHFQTAPVTIVTTTTTSTTTSTTLTPVARTGFRGGGKPVSAPTEFPGAVTPDSNPDSVDGEAESGEAIEVPAEVLPENPAQT